MTTTLSASNCQLKRNFAKACNLQSESQPQEPVNVSCPRIKRKHFNTSADNIQQ